ncbi:MAG: transcription factor S [Candidatus Bathyarchaeia archaeon]
MRFCTQCGGIYAIDIKIRCFICMKCGNKEFPEEGLFIDRRLKEDDKIIVVGEREKNLATSPKVKMSCQVCENNEAFWWMVQTRSIDESTTQFYRCTECGYTWREYS